MFFSVVVPVYKVEKYLKNCVDSILCQTFSDFEVILVDDGSPDGCPLICDEYSRNDCRVKVLHKENGGLASARQAGVKMAQGDYVFNLDSDDAIEKDTLECAYNAISRYACDIVSFGYQWIDEKKCVSITNDGIEEGFYDEDKIKEYIYPKLLNDKNMQHVSYYLSGKAVKRQLLTPIQLGVSPSISLGEDLCCVVPCYLEAKSVYISKKNAYLYTVRHDSLSKEFNSKQIFLVENVMKEIMALPMEKPQDFEDQLCRYSAFMCFAIFAAAAEGGYKKAIREIQDNIQNSMHQKCIQAAKFDKITIKTRIGLYLMKKNRYNAAYHFLAFGKFIKKLLKRG